MLVARRVAVGLVCVGMLAAAMPRVAAQQRALRGFPSDAVEAERQREEAFRQVPDPARLREHLKAMTAEPHHAGGPGSRAVAEYALQQFKAAGLNAAIEEYEAWMPMPVERRVELVAPTTYTAVLKEPAIADDPDSGDAGQLPTFNAYSADGDVTADLVYVNYGIPDDYTKLEELGISVKGKIVVARYGKSWRGIKPKVAYEHGAVGCLIYSDPRDDGYFQNDVYPKGPTRPGQGVQRGSVMDMPVHPGDPLTPGWGSEKGGRKLAVDESKTILKIPVLPISYDDALPLLKALAGPVAPEEWRGALPLTYHVGPGPAKVHLALKFDWANRPVYDVVARIDGAEFPDEWVVYGNHHDGWVNGAADPTSGATVVLETARGLGELLKQGWKPKRTIILALWDGEEWGLLGSTEWAEKHAAELKDKGVVYINSDGNGKGWLQAGGSHSLQQLVSEVARDVADPRTGKPVIEQAREQANKNLPAEEKKKAEADPALRISPLGSGSDYTSFIDHIAVASLNIGFGGESDSGGVYHSIYDSYTWYTRFSDSDFVYGKALAQVVGTILLRLADAPVLPFQFTDYADTLSRYAGEVQKLAAGTKGAQPLDFAMLTTALQKLRAAGQAYDKAVATVPGASAAALAGRRADLAAANKLIYTSERKLAYEGGLPRRDWFKHVAYAPGFYTGYGVKTLPMIREGIEEGHWDEAKQGLAIVTRSITALAAQVDQATAAVTRAVGSKTGSRQ